MKVAEFLFEKVTIGKIIDPSTLDVDNADEWASSVADVTISSRFKPKKSASGIGFAFHVEDVHSDNLRQVFTELKKFGFSQKGDEVWKYTSDFDKAFTEFKKKNTVVEFKLEWQQISVYCKFE